MASRAAAISAGLVLDQVVDIRVAQPRGGQTEVGSGYLISPNLALTARHVVGAAESASVVFTVRDPAQPLSVPAEVAWLGAGKSCDIALLRLRWAAGRPPWPVITAAFGDVPSLESELEFQAVGFPHRKLRSLSPRRQLRDGDRVGGMILGTRNLRTSQLDLHLTADPAGADNAWAGFSGAAVFVHGFLVGVAVEAESATPDWVAHRIAVPAGDYRSLSGSYAEPEQSITRFREVLAGDGHDLRIDPARKRPDYAATIERKIQDLRLSAGLANREAELAELRAFARPGADQAGLPPYADWVAPAWAGKTALALYFASDPPPGVDLVSFFISRPEGRFWADVCDQLADLVNQPPPVMPGETSFNALWDEAARLAERSGRTLVLLLDGLDHDDQFPVIARAVPPDGDGRRRVILFRRADPELPLESGHPLLDQRKCVRKMLVPSDPGGELRTKKEAESTLRAFLTGFQADVLGVLTAAGPIGALDIAMVLGAEDPSLPDYRLLAAREITPALLRAEGAGLVAPTATDPDRFWFQHDTLPEITAQLLAQNQVIGLHRDTVNRLAAKYAALEWPGDTPSYLLTGYPVFLERAGDTARLAELPSQARITRLRARTGDDAAAVDELSRAIRRLAPAQPAGLPAACALAVRRERLLDALARYPVSLIAAHAALGQWLRAEQIADYQAWPAARVAGLTAVAVATASAGQAQRANLLFAKAVRVLTAVGGQLGPNVQRQSLARAAAASGCLVDPRLVSDQFPGPQECVTALADFALAYALAGRVDYAEQFLARAAAPDGPRARAAAAADAVLRTASDLVYGRPVYGRPEPPGTSVAERQSVIQTSNNVNALVDATARSVMSAAARQMRLDTVVRVAAATPGHHVLLPLVGDAFRTAALAGPPGLLSEALAVACQSAQERPDPFQRGVLLHVIAATASGQLARDAALAARQATAGLSAAERAQLDGIVTFATADPPVENLVDFAYRAAWNASDAVLTAATMAAVVQGAATACLPVTDLLADARTAAENILDPVRRTLALATLAQVAAVAAQYAAIQRIVAPTLDAALFAQGARLTAASQLTASGTTASNAASLFYPVDSQLGTVQAFAAGQVASIRSIVAGLPDPAQRAAAAGELAQAAADEPVAGLVTAARAAAAALPEPQRAWTLGTMAQGAVAAGQFSAAELIAADLGDPGQQVWTLGMTARAVVAAGLPADSLIAAARDTATAIQDAGQRAQALGVVAEAAAATGQLAVSQAVATELTDPAQRASAFGVIAQAAAAAGQPPDDFIRAATEAAKSIWPPAQQAWALAQLAQDATSIDQSDLAAQLVSDAEEAALADDPVLRAGLLAALAQAAGGPAERAAAFFDRACQVADVPELTQRAWALAEISRYAPGRPGWSARLQDEARQAAVLTDLFQRSAVLAALVQAASRSGDDMLAQAIAASIPSPGPQVSALVTLARSAAARGDYLGAATLCGNAAQVAAQAGSAAVPGASAAIAAARAFGASLQAARQAGPGGFDHLRALVGHEPVGVLAVDGSAEACVAEVARQGGQLDLIELFARQITDPNRRGYLLAAAARAQLASGKAQAAEATLASMPSPAGLVDPAARGQLLAAATSVLAARDRGAACAQLITGLADFFSAELIPVIAGLDGAAIDRLAQELGLSGAAGAPAKSLFLSGK